MTDHKKYLTLVSYDNKWGVDYISPTLGRTLKLEESQSAAKDYLNKLRNMDNEELHRIIAG